MKAYLIVSGQNANLGIRVMDLVLLNQMRFTDEGIPTGISILIQSRFNSNAMQHRFISSRETEGELDSAWLNERLGELVPSKNAAFYGAKILCIGINDFNTRSLKSRLTGALLTIRAPSID